MPTPSPTMTPTQTYICLIVNSTEVNYFEGTYVITGKRHHDHWHWVQTSYTGTPDKEIYWEMFGTFKGYWIIVGTGEFYAVYQATDADKDTPPPGTAVWTIYSPGTSTGGIDREITIDETGTCVPTPSPSPAPTKMPTTMPTPSPTPSPTTTTYPTTMPTPSPSPSPYTSPPTPSPSPSPTQMPTVMPTPSPSPSPTTTTYPTTMPTPSPTAMPTPWCPCIVINSTEISHFTGTYIIRPWTRNNRYHWLEKDTTGKEIYWAHQNLYNGYWVITGSGGNLAAFDSDSPMWHGTPPIGPNEWKIFLPGTSVSAYDRELELSCTSCAPTPSPSPSPTSQPTTMPTPSPTVTPYTNLPTVTMYPTTMPTPSPTPSPISTSPPTPSPSPKPTNMPTIMPTPSPTPSPYTNPPSVTNYPTTMPTPSPSPSPTTTTYPTSMPTPSPTPSPSPSPTTTTQAPSPSPT